MTIQDDQRGFELRELGETARRKRDLAAAQKYYEEASSLVAKSADKMKFAHTVRHLGDLYVDLRNWESAERCYIEALEIYRRQPEARVLDFANALRAYAVLKDKTGRESDSRDLWAEAGRLYKDVGIQAGIEECNRHTGGPIETAH